MQVKNKKSLTTSMIWKMTSNKEYPKKTLGIINNKLPDKD